MAKIPTLLSSGDVETRHNASPAQSFSAPSFAGAEAEAAAGRSISAGLMDVAQGVNQAINQNKQQQLKLEEKQKYDNHLWAEGQFTTAQRDWAQWLDDVQKNGSEDVVDKFHQEFTQYQQNLLKAAPNEDAAQRLKLRLDDLGTRVFENSLKVEAHNRAQNTVNTFTQMLQDNTDFIAKQPELYAVPQVQMLQDLKSAREQNRIPEDTYQKLKEQANNLSVVAAESLVAKNPDYAEQIINNAEGIDWARRKAVLGEIDRARESNQFLLRYEQNELLKSHIDSIAQTGQGVSNFNLDSYVASMPREHQAAAREEVQNKVEQARSMYVGMSAMKAQTPDKIATILQQNKPNPGDPKYNDKLEVYQKLSEQADQQMKILQKDPFAYSRQDPVVDKAWKLVEDLPKDAKPALVQQLTQQALDASVNFQKNAGVPDGKLSVLSQGAASQLAERLNRGDTKQLQDTLGQMQQTYGKYYPYAFRDLVRLPDGQRVDAAIQVAALHMGKPFLTDFMTAIRTPEAEMKIDNKDFQQLKDRLITDPKFMAFKGAMLSANPAATAIVDDFHQSIQKYAQQIYFRGKAKTVSDAVGQATDLVINSAYGFATVDGTPVAVKRQQDAMHFDDNDVQTIGAALTTFQKSIDDTKIDIKRFAFPVGLSAEAQSTSIKNTLKNDTFWVTNPQNDGAVLYMNGADGTTAPVKWKDGRQVEAPFTLALHKGKIDAAITKSREAKWYVPPITGFYPALTPR